MAREKEYTRDQITEDIEKQVDDGTEICGVKIVLTEDGGIAGVIYSSFAAHKIEMLAGVQNKYIEHLVQNEFKEPLSKVAREISELKGKTYNNVFSKFTKFMESQFNADNSDA